MRTTVAIVLLSALVACGGDGKGKKDDAPETPGANDGRGDAGPVPGGDPGAPPPPGLGPSDHAKAPVVLAPGEGTPSSSGAWLVKAAWAEGPTAETDLSVRLTFAKADRTQPAAATPEELVPWMPAHGHGTDMLDQRVTMEAAHVARVDGIFLNMGGDWVLKVKATIDGALDTATIAVDGVP